MALHTSRSHSTKKKNLMQKGYHKNHQLVVLMWETQGQLRAPPAGLLTCAPHGPRPLTPQGQQHPRRLHQRRLHPRQGRRRAAPDPRAALGHAHWRVTGPVPGGHRGPPSGAAAHARWAGRGPEGSPAPAAPRPPAPPPRMRSGPPGRRGRARSSSLPFSSGPAVSARGSAAPPAPHARRGAAATARGTLQRLPARLSSARRRSGGEDRVSSTPAGPRERWRAQPAPLLTLSPASRRQALPLLPLRGRFLPSFAPRLHEQDNMAPTGAYPEVKRVTVLTLAWNTRTPLATIFAEGSRAGGASLPPSLGGKRPAAGNAPPPPSLLWAATPVPVARRSPWQPRRGRKAGPRSRQPPPAWGERPRPAAPPRQRPPLRGAGARPGPARQLCAVGGVPPAGPRREGPPSAHIALSAQDALEASRGRAAGRCGAGAQLGAAGSNRGSPSRLHALV
ncbi:uncharacterized protein [Ciconia boyciana]|uniref:uncharacterized protein n=1 Tax=Ciconia boyciana TaxID=52775 RepID=UPI003BA20BEB